MAKPFDATAKAMFEASPQDWAALAGSRARNVVVIDADVSTVTAATDKVLLVRDAPQRILHFDFQAGPDATLPERIHCYNALLGIRHGLPVKSIVVLLRPQANLSTITGLYERSLPEEEEEDPYLRFRYRVIRVWELSAASLLNGGLGTLALAPISNVTLAELPGVIEQLKERLSQRRYRPLAAEVWTAIDILMGLRYERAVIDRLLQGVMEMEESVTYQAIIEKGALREARKLLLVVGEERFQGPPEATVRARLEQIDDLQQLEKLTRRIMRIDSWDELLPPRRPAPSSRRRKKT
jgi:predicted transposase YdaD